MKQSIVIGGTGTGRSRFGCVVIESLCRMRRCNRLWGQGGTFLNDTTVEWENPDSSWHDWRTKWRSVWVINCQWNGHCETQFKNYTHTHTHTHTHSLEANMPQFNFNPWLLCLVIYNQTYFISFSFIIFLASSTIYSIMTCKDWNKMYFCILFLIYFIF